MTSENPIRFKQGGTGWITAAIAIGGICYQAGVMGHRVSVIEGQHSTLVSNQQMLTQRVGELDAAVKQVLSAAQDHHDKAFKALDEIRDEIKLMNAVRKP